MPKREKNRLAVATGRVGYLVSLYGEDDPRTQEARADEQVTRVELAYEDLARNPRALTPELLARLDQVGRLLPRDTGQAAA